MIHQPSMGHEIKQHTPTVVSRHPDVQIEQFCLLRGSGDINRDWVYVQVLTMIFSRVTAERHKRGTAQDRPEHSEASGETERPQVFREGNSDRAAAVSVFLAVQETTFCLEGLSAN